MRRQRWRSSAPITTALQGRPARTTTPAGVSALLELAARTAKLPHKNTVRLVAFVNEEPPNFQTPHMGSLVHADGCKARGENIVGMLAIETIGCFSDQADSQTYPAPGMNLILPTVGNFIGVVGSLEQSAFVERIAAAMKGGKRTRPPYPPSNRAALPPTLPGVGWSDHWSFWQHGYPAAMITDTAPFRYAHYHKPTDTPEKLDYVRMAAVVDSIAYAIDKLGKLVTQPAQWIGRRWIRRRSVAPRVPRRFDESCARSARPASVWP